MPEYPVRATPGPAPRGSRYWLEQKVDAWHTEQRALAVRYTIVAIRCVVVYVVSLIAAFFSVFPIGLRLFLFFAGTAIGSWGLLLFVLASCCRSNARTYPEPYLSEDE
ncbi:MAG TPA: hypothetical protein VJP76_01865 [Candidatus Tumulicola sp.]|nr:hypothetical protein [Candidatus Tumulicola sp.]